MHRIDHASSVPALPTPQAVGTPGFFGRGDPLGPTAPTTVTADWANAVQEELLAAVEGEGLVADKTVRSQLYQAILRAAGRSSAGANYLQNGGMRLWQRVSPSASTSIDENLEVRGPDRWRVKKGAAGSVATIFRTTVIFGGAPTSPTAAFYALNLNKSTAAASPDVPELVQRIEGHETLHGQPVVVAFDAKVTSGPSTTLGGVFLTQRFAGAATDVEVELTPTAGLLIDSSTRRLVFLGTLPSVAGKAFNANAHLELRIEFADAATFNVQVTGFVLARGSADPGFIARPIQEELVLCQRFYEHSLGPEEGATLKANSSSSPHQRDAAFVYWDTAVDASDEISVLCQRFRVPKFRTPTVEWYAVDDPGSPGAGTISELATTGLWTTYDVSSFAPSASHTGVPVFDSPPAAGARVLAARWTADAEIPNP